MPKHFKKEKPGSKEYKKAVEEHNSLLDSGMAGKPEYLKKGENPIKPNASGKEYEGPTKKYEKKKTKKKGRKSLRKIKSRSA